MSLAGIKCSGFDFFVPICWAQNAYKSWKWTGRIKAARAQGLAGSKYPKYHAKNHGRRDGHALRPSLQPGVSLMAIPNPQPKCPDRMQEPSPKLQKYGSRPE